MNLITFGSGLYLAVVRQGVHPELDDAARHEVAARVLALDQALVDPNLPKNNICNQILIFLVQRRAIGVQRAHCHIKTPIHELFRRFKKHKCLN